MFVTSYNEEFQWPKQSKCPEKTKEREQLLDCEEIKTREPIIQHSETLRELTKECLLPFNYLLRDKPIIKTDPRDPFPVQEVPKDDDNARLTRPRVFKAPEISLDDIDDPAVRETIIDYTYSTTYSMANKDIYATVTKREVPTTTLEEPDQVRFRKQEDNAEVMCEAEEVMDHEKLNKWEREQSRLAVDPTTTFWTAFRNDTSDKLIDEDAVKIKSPEFTERIICLARENKLRQPYWLKPPYYAGYMPESPIGITPEKYEHDISDPMQTVYTLNNRWREQRK